MRNSYNDSSYLRERAILAPKNCDVDKLNDKLMSMLPGQFHAYMSANTFCATEGDIVENMNSPEVLNSLNFSGLPNHRLELKKGAPIIRLRNLISQRVFAMERDLSLLDWEIKLSKQKL